MRLLSSILLLTLFCNVAQARSRVFMRAESFNDISREELVVKTLQASRSTNAVQNRFARNAQRVSLTLYLLEARRNYDTYSLENQRQLDLIFARPVSDKTFTSSKGDFLIHYTLTGANAVSSVDNDVDGVPDYINTIANYYDNYSTKIYAMGYPAPLNDGDGLFDVYIEHMENSYGVTIAESVDPNVNSSTTYMKLNNNLSDADLKETIVHEFHHAIQFGMALWADSWYYEATSTWIEAYFVAGDMYPVGSMPVLFDNPEKSLSDADDGGYSRSIWNQFLEETKGASKICKIWKNLQDTSSCTNKSVFKSFETVMLNDLTNFQNTFIQFTQWNLATSNYTRFNGSIPTIKSTNFTSESDNISGYIGALGARYSKIAVDNHDVLYVSVNGNNSKAKVYVAKKDFIGGVTFNDVALDSLGQAQVSIANVSNAKIAELYIVAVNTSIEEGDSNDILINYSKLSMPSIPQTSTDDSASTSGSTGGGCLIKALF